MGIKDQLQKLCGRIDKIMPPLEEQNQQLGEGMAESQITTEIQEETENSKDDMPPLKECGDDDLDCVDDLEIPLSGRVLQACEDFDSRTNHSEERGNDMNHIEAIQPAIQPIIQMDKKEHIKDIRSHEAKDIGSHEAKLKLDGPYLNHQGNVMNDEVNVFYDDLKLLKGSITISHGKKFKELSRAKLKEALQGCMKNIWANHEHEDPKRFNGFLWK